ncbi:hypothetical protein HG536_0B02380 [Torulaspora globosa]|uniref:ERCC4 domain-containing protein n=1 Tax=Torulaspora globosa TaxID=48254 RepID=A0A7G3ZCY9_9SACH|nr:uncharacterized protein HG536_0B02380 [Torulaspora globosa]QLL31375.1 hypothetical protein HG536_0B02380 [Torulaspora globosa]
MRNHRQYRLPRTSLSPMNHVIELLDDAADDGAGLTGSSQKSKPEIFTLTSDDSIQPPKGQSQTQYPSSPKEIEVITDTSIHPSIGSIEISAPFCQDLCTTVGDESSIDGDFEPRPRSGKRILEEILNEDSSICYPRVDSSTTCEVKLKDGMKRLRGLEQEHSQKHSPVREDLAYTHDDVSKNRKAGVLETGADILETYPISSPAADLAGSKRLKRGQSRQLFVQNSDCSFNAEEVSESDVLSQGSVSESEIQRNSIPTSGKVKGVPILPVALPNRRDKHTDAFNNSVKVKGVIDQAGLSQCRRSEILELNVRKFPSDKNCKDNPCLPDELSKPARSSESDSDERTSAREASNDMSKAREVIRLTPYIVHGRCYSDDEALRLMQTWLGNSRRAFKESNQIYRSNEKARSCITVTMSSRLIKTFESSGCDLENGIKPATLQASIEEELPRIGFLRTCESEYDFAHDIFFPCEKTAVEEALSILYYDAQVFFELYRTDKEYLFRRFRSFTRSGKYLIVVLSNLKRLARALEALEDKKYKARVQDELTGSQATRGHNSKKKTSVLEDLSMKKFDIEQRLRFIDRLWGVRIHVVSSHAEFTESLPNLVSLIAKQRMDPAIRYMRYSHINARSGKDKTDVLRQTLQQINKMPELKANSVIAAYSTFQALFTDFKKGELKSGLDGQYLMTEAMEARLYKLFTCEDPNESIQ